MSVPRLSILIPTLPRRLVGHFTPLAQELERQATGLPVEIIALYDNKTRPLGDKRNALLDLAQGTHLVFIDDDDWVVDDYVSTIVAAIETHDPDVIVYEHELCAYDGNPPVHARCGKELPWHYDAKRSEWTGKPTHIMPWRTSLARRARFPSLTFAEDRPWIDLLWRQIDWHKQLRIDRLMYFYRFDPAVTETR
jgi:glycosyltransferase involved in cell wall biosynthesis